MKEEILHAPAIPHKKNTLGVIAVIISLFLAAIDSTIVSTVLPSISGQLGHPSLYPWIMSAFLLPVALIAPIAGACGDRFGVSNTLKVCVVIFIAASALAAKTSSMQGLIFARALQGVGASGIIVLSYSFLAAIFDAEKRGKMQGMLSGVWGLSAILGPLLGSILSSTLGWRSVFWFNIPLGLLALLLLFIIPAVGRVKGKLKIDFIAQMLLIVFACGVLLVISNTGELAFNMNYNYGIIFISFILLVFRVITRKKSSPIPLQFFQHRSLFSVIVLVLFSSAGLYASVTLLPLAMAHQTETTASTGLLIMLAALGWVIGAAICGSKLAKLGYRNSALCGMLLLTMGAALMIPGIGNYGKPLIAFALLLIGLGMGFTATTTLVLTQNKAPAEHLGSWTATVQFLRNMGAALGINLLANIQLGLSGVYAYQICFTILGVCMLIGVFFTLLMPKNYSLN